MWPNTAKNAIKTSRKAPSSSRHYILYINDNYVLYLFYYEAENERFQRKLKIFDFLSNSHFLIENIQFSPISTNFGRLQKQIDALSDQRDSLQIELAESVANVTAAQRKFGTLKTRYQTLSEEFTQLQQDHQRDQKQV